MMILLLLLPLLPPSLGKDCSGGASCVPVNECPKFIADQTRLGNLPILSTEYADLRTSLADQFCHIGGDEKVCCLKNQTQNKIHFGRRVDPHYAKTNYPWIVRLAFEGTYYCGGVLVHERLILTARHCIQRCSCFRPGSGGSWSSCKDKCTVKLREYDDFERGDETLHSIQQVFAPPGLPGVSFKTADSIFDIVIIKLDKSVNHCYEEDPEKCYKIEPITLATKETKLDTSSDLKALGWGATDQTLEQSRYLRQVPLVFNSVKECACKEFYFLYTNVGPNGEDACAGDSGGPLVLSSSGTFTLVGILKGDGIECAKLFDVKETSKIEPGKWMRISSFRGWISGVIDKETKVDDRSWGEWGQWSTCSKRCGGSQNRTRVCNKPKNGDQECDGTGFQTQTCDYYCKVDGSWGEWEQWSRCSANCDGSQNRTRVCNKPRPQDGGKECAGKDSDYQPCSNCEECVRSLLGSTSTVYSLQSERIERNLSRKDDPIWEAYGISVSELKELAYRNVNQSRVLKILLNHVETVEQSCHNSIVLVHALEVYKDLMSETEKTMREAKTNYTSAYEQLLKRREVGRELPNFPTSLPNSKINIDLTDVFCTFKVSTEIYIEKIEKKIAQSNILLNDVEIVMRNIEKYPLEKMRKYKSYRDVFITGMDDFTWEFVSSF